MKRHQVRELSPGDLVTCCCKKNPAAVFPCPPCEDSLVGVVGDYFGSDGRLVEVTWSNGDVRIVGDWILGLHRGASDDQIRALLASLPRGHFATQWCIDALGPQSTSHQHRRANARSACDEIIGSRAVVAAARVVRDVDANNDPTETSRAFCALCDALDAVDQVTSK